MRLIFQFEAHELIKSTIFKIYDMEDFPYGTIKLRKLYLLLLSVSSKPSSSIVLKYFAFYFLFVLCFI